VTRDPAGTDGLGALPIAPAPSHLAGVGHDPLGDPAIAVADMSFHYPDGTFALEDIRLHVARRSTLALIGPNGGGKTTLLKILLGLLDGYSGSVSVAGMMPRAARARGDVVSWVPQRTAFNWDFPVTVRDVIAMGLLGRTGIWHRPSPEERRHLERVIEALELGPIAGRPIGDLSGGQQQRVVIARALAPRSQILMLDEPSVGVDENGKQRLIEALDGVKKEFGITLVLVSHDLRMILASSQRIACLNRILHFHDAPEALTEAVLREVYGCDLDGLLPPACRHGGGHHEET
jgi:zinc transport system ATP-binding protein